ncbi:hypothetical protein BLX06_08910 [Bacillus cereus]|uniref:Uncharacterized protein n=2 Tax=Bacillus cereus TaxID=1396 RepID=A0A9X6GGC0_BACCE|nr:hypothetical protein BLX06_08910 [Bacillus cereus]
MGKERRKCMYENRQVCWEQFWKEQLTINGEMDIEQIKQELFEYKTLLEQINQPQQAVMQPQILIQLAVEQRIQKHQEKTLALA